MSAWNHVRFTGMCSLDKGCELVFGLVSMVYTGALRNQVNYNDEVLIVDALHSHLPVVKLT